MSTPKPKFVCGIDYSMTCPAICCHPLDLKFAWSNCQVYFLSPAKKYEQQFANILGTPYPDYSHAKGDINKEMTRFDRICNWATNSITDFSTEPGHVVIEGYAMGAKGRVFHIAENTGILKYNLWNSNGYDIQVAAPTTIKKFATGKGNANKDRMYECFLEETGCDLLKLLSCQSEKIGSPVGDIVDSYYLCKFGHHSESR
jgi:hypothetical protein